MSEFIYPNALIQNKLPGTYDWFHLHVNVLKLVRASFDMQWFLDIQGRRSRKVRNADTETLELALRLTSPVVPTCDDSALVFCLL